MKRRDLLATCGSLSFLTTAGCLAAPRGDVPPDDAPARQDVQSVTEWRSFLNDEENRRCFSGSVTPGEDVAWTFETGDAIWGSPVIADGRLYIGSYDGHLYALSVETGELIWRYSTGDRIDGSATVADGTVYVGSFDRNLYALDAATGEERWMYGSEGIIRSSPVVVDGTIYVGSHCRVEECTAYYDVRWPAMGYVLALDAETGDLQWRYATDDGILPTPAVSDGRVFIGSSDSTLYALSAHSGEQLWSYDTGAPMMASPTCADDRVYIASLSGDVHGLTVDEGEWVFQYSAPVQELDEGIAAKLLTSSPVICGDRGYVGAIETDTVEGPTGALWAFSPSDGFHQWAVRPLGQMVGSSPTVVDGDVYVASHTLQPTGAYDPGILVFTEDGELKWSFTVDGATNRGFGSSPVIAEGKLFIGGSDGTVYAFDLEAAATAE